jgi:hypothetical protein
MLFSFLETETIFQPPDLAQCAEKANAVSVTSSETAANMKSESKDGGERILLLILLVLAVAAIMTLIRMR